MKIGVRSSHAYSLYGGGYQALRWHIKAFKALGHDVVFHTTNTVSKEVLDNWIDGVSIRYYLPHVEKEYDVFLDIDHFSRALPEAKKLNLIHTFFPQPNVPPPAEGVKIYSNSEYTARHIKHNWGRDAIPMYIPIDNTFRSGNKTNTIMHVSRFSEPSIWADKAHAQMIQSFKMISRRLPGWRLLMVGGAESQQEYYLDSLMRLATGYEVDFMTSVSNARMAELYASASVYWHATGVSLSTIPSAQEHMGIAPIEAQASGCVPICYNSGGIPEVVLDHRTGLLFDNIQDLPAMTIGLLENMGKWSQLSQNGQMWAAKRADFDAFVTRIDDMLNDRPITPIADLAVELKHAPSEVTVLIPTFNSPLLEKCLTVLKTTAPTAKVVVVNNGDELPESVKAKEGVEFIEVGRNLGFSGALRLAEPLIKTPFVLTFNDDVIANNPDWLEYMLLAMNNPSVGIVGSKLLYPDGRLQHAGGALDWNRPDIGFHRFFGNVDGVEASTPQTVDFVTGACMLVRRELFHLPEELADGLYFEELWLSNEAREKGFSTVYQPASVLTHYEGETRARTPESQEKIEHNKRAFVGRWGK